MNLPRNSNGRDVKLTNWQVTHLQKGTSHCSTSAYNLNMNLCLVYKFLKKAKDCRLVLVSIFHAKTIENLFGIPYTFMN